MLRNKRLLSRIINIFLFEKNKKQNEEDKNRYYREYSSVDRFKHIIYYYHLPIFFSYLSIYFVFERNRRCRLKVM